MKKIKRRSYANHVLANLNKFSPVLQRVFAARGITHENELEKGLGQLESYHTLIGIEAAAEHLATAVVEDKRILIIGDFDADGATATAIAVRALRSFGAKQVEFLVPNRFEYGYGLTPAIVEVAAKWKPDFIVTVDNGISSVEGVKTASDLGIKVIITDHHLAGNELPAALAIVNPNQPADPFVSKSLAGVGVIYYVMLAVRANLLNRQWFTASNIQQPNMGDLLDIVALGTVADVVALDKNNRILVYQGIQRIRQSKCCPGIAALTKVANRTLEKIVASDLAFSLAPRLNAAGRLDDMSLGIECLLSEDPARALELAQQLHELNIERRQIEADMQQQALAIVNKLHLEQRSLPLGLCLYDETWHQGVIGIVASRLKDRLYRPVIAFADASEGTEIKGSARSVAGVHIRDSLDAIAKKHPELLSKFGGHAMAAGLSIEKEKLSEFKQAFEAQITSEIDISHCVAELITDGPLSSSDLTLELAMLLREAGPWGQHFPEPVFDNEFIVYQQRLIGGKHLKLSLGFENSPLTLDGIIFNVDLNSWPNYRCQKIHAVYRLDVNEYQGKTSLQLLIENMETIA